MTHRVLVADDSPMIQRVVRLAFQNEDVEVVAVGTGAEARREIQAVAPHVVLADTRMPDGNGYDVAEFVWRLPVERRVPVILLTGAFEPVDDRRARAAGCETVLVKPFEAEQLVAAVHALLGIDEGAGAESADASPPAEAPVWSDVDDSELAWSGTTESGERRERWPASMTEDLVEQVSTRVITTMSDRVVRETTTEVVAKIAERMVRTEVASRLSDDVVRETTADVVTQVAERMVRQELAARLSDQVLRDTTAAVVGEVAERLVREEIERLKEKLR